MNSKAVIEAYRNFTNTFNLIDFSTNPALKLLNVLCNELLDEKAKEKLKKEPEEEWLLAKEFVDKYSICSDKHLYSLRRYNSDVFPGCKKVGHYFYFNPKLTFLFLTKRREDFKRTYNKLKANNFFGFETECKAALQQAQL